MASLSRDERHLITIEGLDYFVNGLASVFVTIFIFAHSDLRTTVLFSLWSFVSLLVFIVAAAWVLRRVSSGLLMKISIVCGAVFYLLLFYLQGNAIHYLFPLAIFSGFGGGMFWASFNLNQYILTNEVGREQYFGWAMSVINFLSAIAPFIGGSIITLAGTTLYFGVSPGYALLFFIVFILLLCMVLFIGKLPSHEIPQFSYRDLFRKSRTRTWNLVLGQQMLLGLYDVAFGTISGVLFYLILRQEFWVGAAQAISYLLGTVTGVVSAKFLRKDPRWFWLGSLGLAAGNLVFAVMQNTTGLWIFVIVTGITGPFINTWLSTVSFQAIDAVKDHWRDKYHFLVERDIVLGVPRVISYIVLYMLLAHGDQVTLAREWLYIAPVLPFTIGVLLHMSHINSSKAKVVSTIHE